MLPTYFYNLSRFNFLAFKNPMDDDSNSMIYFNPTLKK